VEVGGVLGWSVSLSKHGKLLIVFFYSVTVYSFLTDFAALYMCKDTNAFGILWPFIIHILIAVQVFLQLGVGGPWGLHWIITLLSELKFLSQKSLACGSGAEESLTLYRSKFICMICSWIMEFHVSFCISRSVPLCITVSQLLRCFLPQLFVLGHWVYMCFLLELIWDCF
jgi:hypothetical protein